MKTISVRDLQKRVRETVEISQKEKVVITRHGRPAAIVVGVEGSDWEDVFYRTSPEFWKMIQERRKEKPISLAEMRKRLGLLRSRRKARR